MLDANAKERERRRQREREEKVLLRNADALQVGKAQNQSSSFFFLLNSIIDSFTHCTRDNYHPVDGSMTIELVRISTLIISLTVTSELT